MSVTEAPAFGGATETLVYDGLGQRVQKILPGGTTVYEYDAFGQLAAEYSTNPPTSAPCSTCYLSYDHLGSLRMVTDQNTNVIARHDYLPFGEEIPGGSAGRSAQWGTPDGVTQRFTGQIRDSETGVDYFNARYYGSALGRFTSSDPYVSDACMVHPQQWDRYSYVVNNPLSFTDPTGEFLAANSPDANPPAVDDGGNYGSVFVFYGNGYFGSRGPGGVLARPHGAGGRGVGFGSNAHVPQPPNPLIPPPPPGQKNCAEQLSDIYDLINGVRGSGSSGFKGLAQRFNQIPRMPMNSRPGHITQFLARQGELQRMINVYRNGGCGDSPADVMGGRRDLHLTGKLALGRSI